MEVDPPSYPRPPSRTSYGSRALSPALKADALKSPSRLSYPVVEEPSKEQEGYSSVEASNDSKTSIPSNCKTTTGVRDFFKTSVDEFLRKSNEMKDEFRKLEVLCKELSPKRKADIDSDADDIAKDLSYLNSKRNVKSVYDWRPLNDLLTRHGYKPLTFLHGGELANPKELEDVFNQMAQDNTLKDKNLREANAEIKRLVADLNDLTADRNQLKLELRYAHTNEEAKAQADKRFKDLEATNRDLQTRLKQAERKEPIRKSQKDQTHSREKSVFKAFMGRDYSPHSSKDSKVMGVIMMYEDQRQALEQDIEKLTLRERDLYAQLRESTALFKGRPTENRDQGFIKKLAEMLECEASTDGVVERILTLLKVISVMPSLEEAVRQVCELVLKPTQSIHDLVPAVALLCKEAKAMLQIKQALGELKPTLNFETYLSTGLQSDLSGITLYKLLFKLEASDNLEVSVQQVFFFVHELKNFLKDIRRTLRLPAETQMQQVMEHLTRQVAGK